MLTSQRLVACPLEELLQAMSDWTVHGLNRWTVKPSVWRLGFSLLYPSWPASAVSWSFAASAKTAKGPPFRMLMLTGGRHISPRSHGVDEAQVGFDLFGGLVEVGEIGPRQLPVFGGQICHLVQLVDF